ncbi:hypothetical protein FIBSPDRAFT_853005 [Athelia psychrophila]|uniref:Uncharacterized protein n=1 Tax=Athelia psychrophila TaxID=1759441 RepID=A0A166REH1_9AGAM|nr:hypothetical protein FIBSPDRAFT_853005 [Fibularhizoctonia sp. CBS 109695]
MSEPIAAHPAGPGPSSGYSGEVVDPGFILSGLELGEHTTREAARAALLEHAGTKVQALREGLAEARHAYAFLEQQMQATEEDISRRERTVARAEAAERYFQLALADEALAAGADAVCVQSQGSGGGDQKVLLLSGAPERIDQVLREETASSCAPPSASVPAIP